MTAAPVARGLLGVLVLLAAAVACSGAPRAIRPRIVAGGLLLQAAIGGLALFVPAGRAVFAALAHGTGVVLAQSAPGIAFLFGRLGERPDDGFVFAVRVLPQIVYISALIEILYHWGIVPRVADIVGRAVAALMGVARISGFAAVLTTLLGQSELPIGIRPAVPRLTRSELFAAMSSGAASVAGSVLAGYASLGIDLRQLLAASFMAVPGGLLFAHILHPERERGDSAPLRPEEDAARLANVFEAVSAGVARGVRVAVMVGATLVAFIGLLALADVLLGAASGALGARPLTLEHLFGLAFAPVAWLIGVPAAEAATVGRLIGEKLVFNEFVGYVDLARTVRAGGLADARARAIATFALCGFANFSSAAILLAAFGSVAPARRSEIARLVLRAVLAGTLSNLLSADLAGLFLAA